MKKIKSIILMFVIALSFLLGVSEIKALPMCDIDRNYGSFQPVTAYDIETCGIKDKKPGCILYGQNVARVLNYNMTVLKGDSTSWHEGEVSFGYAFAADALADGDYVTEAKATFYDDTGTAQCYIEFDKEQLKSNKYELVGWKFKFNKKHVSYIEFEGKYNNGSVEKSYNGSNAIERVNVYKKTDGSGINHEGDGSSTTTSIESADEDAIESEVVKKTSTSSGGGATDVKAACTSITALFDEYWPIVMVITPILLIVMITIDFFKAMASGDADALRKSGTNTVKRTIAAVVLLALPNLVRIVFDLFGIEICL